MSASQIFLGIAITVAAQDIVPATLELSAILIVSRPTIVTAILPRTTGTRPTSIRGNEPRKGVRMLYAPAECDQCGVVFGSGVVIAEHPGEPSSYRRTAGPCPQIVMGLAERPRVDETV